MPIQVARYLCQYCKTQYDDFQSASNCEMLGQPTLAPLSIGEILTFENEETLFGSRYSYMTQSGPIIHVEMTLNKKHSLQRLEHTWIYFVNGGHVEYLVVLGQDEFGNQKYMSQAEWKYRPGYAESLKLKNYY